MKKHIALGAAVVAALAVVILMFTSLVPWQGAEAPRTPVTVPPGNTEGMESYDAPEYGIAFDYPDHYLLSEEEVGTAQRGHYHIDLVEDTPENRMVKAGLAPGREGPIAISFDIYQNDAEKTKILDWVKGNADSNFKLGDGTYEETEIGGTPAVFYRHSGLYEANAFVFAHGGNIVKATVTYLTPEDGIISDFSTVLSSLELY